MIVQHTLGGRKESSVKRIRVFFLIPEGVEPSGPMLQAIKITTVNIPVH